jgi:hypothetical protein
MDDDDDGEENARQRKKIGCGRENAMDGKSIMDQEQERPLLAFFVFVRSPGYGNPL